MKPRDALIIWLDADGEARAARAFCGWLYPSGDGHEVGVGRWSDRVFEGTEAIEEAERFTAELNTGRRT